MKKTVKILALAFVAMTVAVACNGNAESADTIDTMPIDTPAIEAPIEDTVSIDTPVVEEPQATKTNTKKPSNKKPVNSTPDASKVTLSNSNTGATLSSNGKGVKVQVNNTKADVDASGVKLSNSNTGNTMKIKTN